MNKVILMGRLTKDPELRYTQSNIAVVAFTLAVDRRFQKKDEEKQTDFFPIVAWRECAEFCSKYFKKGLRVAVSGSLQTRTWDDTEGKKHYVTEVVADEVAFADGKKDEGAGASAGGQQPAQQQQQNQQPPKEQTPPQEDKQPPVQGDDQPPVFPWNRKPAAT